MLNIKVYMISNIPNINSPNCLDLNIAVVYNEINKSVKIEAKIYEKLNLMCSLKDNKSV